MKKIYFFNVYDKVGETYLNEKPLMAQSVLTACLSFYNTFIKEKDPLKNPYNPKAVELHIQGLLSCDDEGLPKTFDNLDAEVIKSQDVVERINQIMAERDVQDFIIDDEKEKE